MNVRRSLILASLPIFMVFMAGPTVVYADSPTFWPAGALTQTTTWTEANSPYVLQGSVSVPAGMTLTVQAGVIVKLPGGLDVSGRLHALGTSSQPVTFTSYLDDSQGGDTDYSPSTGSPGQWQSVAAVSGGRVHLEHAVLRYGGAWYNLPGDVYWGNLGGSAGVLEVSDSRVEQGCDFGVHVWGGTVSIRDSEILQTVTCAAGRGDGLYLSASGDVAPVITGTQFVSNTGYAAYLDLGSVGLDGQQIRGLTAVGNGRSDRPGNAVGMNATFTGTSVLVDPGIPYVNNGLTVNAGVVVTIQQGAIVKSLGQGVLVYGTLEALGTGAAPVVFTSLYDDAYGGKSHGTATLAASGQWQSVAAVSGGRVHLEQAVLRYGGAWYNLPGDFYWGNLAGSAGVLEMSDSRVEEGCDFGVHALGGTVSIRDSEIKQTVTCAAGRGDGLYLSASGSAAPVITGTQFVSNTGYAAYLDLGFVALDGQQIRGLTAVGNGRAGRPGDALGIQATFTGTSVLVDPGIPYVNNGLTVNAGVVVTIQQGAIVKSPGTAVLVYGTLNGLGTEGAPVVFTSLYDDAYGGKSHGTATAAASGQWQSVAAVSGGRVHLEHAVLRYGGAYYNLPGDVYWGNLAGSAGVLEVSDSRVEQGCDFGVHAWGGTVSIRDSEILQTVTCAAGRGDGLYLSASGDVAPVITGTQFVSNTGYAAYLDLGTVALDGQQIRGLTAVGNGRSDRPGNAVGINATFTGTSVLVDPGIPYVNNGLTVNAGVVVTMQQGAIVKSSGQGVLVYGTLNGLGTELAPVVFTSLYDDTNGGKSHGTATAAASGQWQSVAAVSGGRVHLAQAVLRYGGAWYNLPGDFYWGNLGGSAGVLEVSDSRVEQGCDFGVHAWGGTVSIRDSEIKQTVTCAAGRGDGLYVSADSGSVISPTIIRTHVISSTGWGIRLYDATSAAVLQGSDIAGNGAGGVYLERSSPSFSGNLITNNPTGVYCAGSSQPVIGGGWENGNDIYSNTVGYGVENASAVTVTATYNWWGSPTGPTHAGNPDGLGDKVTDWVDYMPYLGASTRPPTPVLAMAPTGHDFGQVDVLSTSPAHTFVVTNTGSGAWNAGAATITGAGAANFQLAGGTCPSSSLVPISTCTSLVRFAPMAAGPVTVTLTLPASSPGGITLTALLRGTGIAKVFLPLVLRGY